ncbi:MAG TPA: hypothetical protein VI911_04340 [Patescibacteria group bacterium]|nr:hypothetical protein [Patescibacteria group bacterium]
MSSTVPYKSDGVLGTSVFPGFGGTQLAKGTITSAQVLDLKDTPKTLVAAPGSGKALVFKEAHLFLDYNSAVYVIGTASTDDMEIRYTNASGQEVASIEMTGFVDQTNDEHVIVKPASAAVATPEAIVPVENAALVLTVSNADLTTGDSPIYFEVEYDVIEFAIDGN